MGLSYSTPCMGAERPRSSSLPVPQPSRGMCVVEVVGLVVGLVFSKGGKTGCFRALLSSRLID